ncbi:hypothetical protein I3843_10G098100 [Carya illinoinensis]|nr:hypothetical protein I3843_10G098100 [Carya illinoinensis]
MGTIAYQLVDLLWKNVLLLPERDFTKLVQDHSSFLFDAARSGNVEFIIILIRSYPDLIWSVDQNKRSIFHLAIKYRQESVFNLIYELGAIKGIISLYTDQYNNNMLHLAGQIAPPNRLNTISGAALQLQRELLWFKMMNLDQNKNPANTPWELFTKTHEHLQKEGEKWMKDTANYSMLVATLIATVVFSAAFTVPDAITFLSSSTAILIFLSILTSRYAEEDFLQSLPARLLLGLTALLISIAGMVVAFSVTCFLVYHNETPSVPIVIIGLAGIPVTLFLVLHYRLWVDIFHSTYGSRFLFRPREVRLF